MHLRLAPALAALAVLALAAPGALAYPDLTWRGSLSSDLRLYTDDSLAYERSENTAQVRLSARLDSQVAAVGHLRLVFTDRGAPADFAALTDRALLDPWRLESDALFVEVMDLGLDGLDLRLGRQQLIWGSADRFHPTSNLNPLDVEDPIAFGEVIANEMVTLSWRPDWSVGGDWDEGVEPWLGDLVLELAFVPFFKPAQLPQSAGLAFTERAVFAGRANTPLLRDLVLKQDVLETNNGWEFLLVPRVELPERTLRNSQYGVRLGARVADIDLHFSYYRGFFAFPRAEKIIADTTALPRVGVDIALTYPRMQVLGFDAATSLDFLGGLGLWTELAVTLHDDLYRVVSTGPAIGVNAAEVEHAEGAFVKAVVGVDYTFTEWLYVNVQYLHGFVDEFGARELGNYIVAGGDIKLDFDRFLIRFFNIFNLDDGTYVLYPQVVFKPWQGGELVIGSFIYSSSFVGFDESTKFNSRAAGSSSVFIQARASL